MRAINNSEFDVDKYLVEMLRVGDNRAFAALYDKYWTSLYEKAYRKTQSKETAEELIQEIFVSLWANREQLKIEKTFEVYIHTSLKYKIINHVKSQITRRKYAEQVIVEESFSIVEEEMRFKELKNAIDKEIKKLPAKYKNVYHMRKNEGLSYKEIASKLQIPLSTVEKHMSKAIKMLRSNLQHYVVN